MKNLLLLSVVFIMLMAMNSKGPLTHIGLASGSHILNQIPEANKVRAQLDSFKTVLDKQLQVKINELQQKQQAYELEKETLVDIVRADREAELGALQESIIKFQQSAQEAYLERESELMRPILNDFHVALSSVAADYEYTHIFNVDAANGSSLLLYAHNTTRVDSLVLSQMKK